MMIKLYLNDCDIMTISESSCPFLFIDSHMVNYHPTLILIFSPNESPETPGKPLRAERVGCFGRGSADRAA